MEFFEAVEGSKKEKRTNRINRERPTENQKIIFSPQDIYYPGKIKAKLIKDSATCSLSMLARRWGTFAVTRTFIMLCMILC